jgi:hypothetical protein
METRITEAFFHKLRFLQTENRKFEDIQKDLQPDERIRGFYIDSDGTFTLRTVEGESEFKFIQELEKDEMIFHLKIVAVNLRGLY